MFEPQDYRWQRTCASNVVQVWLSFTHTISQVDLHAALAKAFHAKHRPEPREGTNVLIPLPLVLCTGLGFGARAIWGKEEVLENGETLCGRVN